MCVAGDIRLFDAVDLPDYQYLNNVCVFSTLGPRAPLGMLIAPQTTVVLANTAHIPGAAQAQAETRIERRNRSNGDTHTQGNDPRARVHDEA